MKDNATWSLEVVLRVFELAAAGSSAARSCGGTSLRRCDGFLLATQYLGPRLHLPANSCYVIVLGIPLLTFVVYAFVFEAAEAAPP